jgi:ribonuclease R
MIGAKSGETHRLGDRVTVRLVEAAPVAGALRFELLSEGRYHGARRRGVRERAAHAQSANRAQRERTRKR